MINCLFKLIAGRWGLFLHSAMNCEISWYEMYHLTLSLLLLYFVKFYRSTVRLVTLAGIMCTRHQTLISI